MKQSLFQLFLNDASTLFSYLFNRQFKSTKIVGPCRFIGMQDCFATQTVIYNNRVTIHSLIQVSQETIETIYQNSYAAGTTNIADSELGFCLLGQISQTLTANFLARNIVKKNLGYLLTSPPIIRAVSSDQPEYHFPRGLASGIRDEENHIQIFAALQTHLGTETIASLKGAWRPSDDLYIYQND